MTQPPSCTHPNHLPPAELGRFPGTHLHECPGCRKVLRFTVEHDVAPQHFFNDPQPTAQQRLELDRAITKVVVGTNR